MRISSFVTTCAMTVAAIGLVTPLRANRALAAGHAIAGAWTLNNDLSDQPGRDQRDEGAESGRRGAGGGRGPGGGGRRGGGGFGGGWGGRGGDRGSSAGVNPEEMARLREALSDLTSASNHLTIVETDSMVVITSADGRTTRLSPDGKKIKDESTGIERKTKWEGEKLVTEITGLGAMGKATQTIAADSENHQLRIVVQLEGGRSGGGGQTAGSTGRNRGPRTITHVYDDDKYTR
jgi:hypothetical protein